MKIMCSKLCLLASCCALAFCTLQCTAQMGASSAQEPAVGTTATPAKAFDSQLTVIEE